MILCERNEGLDILDIEKPVEIVWYRIEATPRADRYQ